MPFLCFHLVRIECLNETLIIDLIVFFESLCHDEAFFGKQTFHETYLNSFSLETYDFFWPQSFNCL